MSAKIAASGSGLAFPSWGRAFWQDPNDGQLICLYASGTQEVDFIVSSDSGNTWSAPEFAFPIDDFSTHNNFDTSMDRIGHVHCVHRYNGSGCYTVLGKTIGSGWAPSGTVARGFFSCRSTGPARDFNGAVEVYDISLGLFGDPAASVVPAARIVAVDSSDTVKAYYVGTPFSGWPVFQSQVSSENVGTSGGFPIPTDAGAFGALACIFAVDVSGLFYREHAFGSWGDSSNYSNPLTIDPGADEDDTLRKEGQIGDVTFGPNMAWCRTDIGKIFPILTTTEESGRFELWGTAQEPFGVGQWFGRIDSFKNESGLGPSRLTPNNLTFKNFINNIAGADKQISGGVPVDISYFDAPIVESPSGTVKVSNVNYYFLQRKLNGDQTIFRIKSNVSRGVSTEDTEFTFSDLNDDALGIYSWADTSLYSAGSGSIDLPNTVYWRKFKVVRTPVRPGGALQNDEIIATIGGTCSDDNLPESVLYMWRYEDSLASSPVSKLPTYTFEHTADSGNTFVGILNVSGIVDPTNLFDGQTSTSGAIASGDYITLEFSKALTFNRIELLWNTPPSTFLGFDVESSFDNVTYNNVCTVEPGISGASPSLVKISAEYNPFNPNDSTVNQQMDGFAGKFVKLTFTGTDTTARDVREIKLYGGNSTAGFISTSGWDITVVTSRTEKFATTPQGFVPASWSTSGDWNWFVDIGTHQSGFFIGDKIGYTDRAAVRTARDAPANTSGVLDLVVNVVEPKNISYQLKWDLQGDPYTLLSRSDPNDDKLEFFLITPTGTVDLTSDIYAAAIISPRDYFGVNVYVPDYGQNTLRWVFTRGSRDPGQLPGRAEAAAWIDNVDGLDSIDGSPNPYTYLNAYLNTSPILISDTVYTYTEGYLAEDESINAYVMPTYGIPSDTINAYHAGEFFASGNVNAYVAAIREFGDPNAYIEGFLDTPSESVYGYMYTSGAFDMLYGHMQNRVNEAINGYLLGPNGAFDTINAYIATPEFMAINGYLKTEESRNISVNAYLKANGFGDKINGYMLVSGLTLQSYGYIKADGALESIYGYTKTGDSVDINGFIKAFSEISGVINAWTSGLGAVAATLNSYVAAISGNELHTIYGYLDGADVDSDVFNAHIIGFGGSGECDFPVPNPGFVSIPTGVFFS